MSLGVFLVLALLEVMCVILYFLEVVHVRFAKHIEAEMKRLHGDYRKFGTTNTGPIENFELEVEIKEPK